MKMMIGEQEDSRVGRQIKNALGKWTWGFSIVCVVFAANASAQDAQPLAKTVSFKTLFSFDGTDGGNPYSQLVQGIDGQLYGTTSVGGANGGGNFFKLLPDGSPDIRYSFCGQPSCADGSDPLWLVLGPDGNFYGANC
jgi:uncharacterized repeat protein (TIGR03803 family)